MTITTWSAVDDYISERLISEDAALAANRVGGLPAIDVSPAQGKFLSLLVRISGAKRVLEMGTLGGYSTIWMARALPEGGRVTTLELMPAHAEVAKRNIAAAGLADRVDVLVGPALESLEKLVGANTRPFDVIFIDADKPNNPNYLDYAMKLARSGAVIVCDNVIRDGAVTKAGPGDANVEGARAAFDFIRAHPRLDGTALQTVGVKGYDGFAIAVVR